jgi:antirestriction protein ArdC
MGIRGGERMERVVEGAWVETFPWSRPLSNPELDQRAEAPSRHEEGRGAAGQARRAAGVALEQEAP